MGSAACAACSTLLGEIPEGTRLEKGNAYDGGLPGDGAPQDDGGIGDPGDGAVRPNSYCATLASTKTVTFCRDFDDGRIFSADFNIAAASGATILAATNEALSPPRALVVDIPASVQDPHALMYRYFDGIKPKDITLAFDMRIELAGSNAQEARVFEIISQFDTPNEHALLFHFNAGSAHIEEVFGLEPNAQWFDYPFLGGRHMETGKWSRVEVRIADNRLTAQLDGIKVVDQPLHKAWAPEPVELALGLPDVKYPGFAWRARYDNVVLDLR
ncbi:hypothetical protein [Pendulispora albinea]|uniref:Uncharacterized protein n=1 Tax=Pendulispora albinea TaxID=2741071 RepID=A0ABZ2M8T8_9BACT